MTINSLSEAFITKTPSTRQLERQQIEEYHERRYWKAAAAQIAFQKLIDAEKADHAAWLARQPESLSLVEEKRADNARFVGRSVQFLHDGGGFDDRGNGQYGTVVEAKRMCRPGRDIPHNFELRVRLSQVGRVGFEVGGDPGLCVVVTLDDVKFID